MKSDLRECIDAIQDADRRVPDGPTTVLYLPCLKISLACEGGSIELLSFSYTHSCKVTAISDRGLVHWNFPSLSTHVFFELQFSSNRATFSLFDRFARKRRVRPNVSSLNWSSIQHASLSLAGIDKIRDHLVTNPLFLYFDAYPIRNRADCHDKNLIVRIDACYVFVGSFVEFCGTSVEKSDDTSKLEMRSVRRFVRSIEKLIRLLYFSCYYGASFFFFLPRSARKHSVCKRKRGIYRNGNITRTGFKI